MSASKAFCCSVNPVKHDFVERPGDWPYSSNRRDLDRGRRHRPGAGRDPDQQGTRFIGVPAFSGTRDGEAKVGSCPDICGGRGESRGRLRPTRAYFQTPIRTMEFLSS